MQTKPMIEPAASPVPGVIPKPWRVRQDPATGQERPPATSRTTMPASSASGVAPHVAPVALRVKERRVMRERHFPRVCCSCQAPMARQEDTCWQCGAGWASDDAPTLRVIAGGTPAHADRWVDDGGSVVAEAPLPLGASVGNG